MMILEWLSIVLIICGLSVVCLNTTRLSHLWAWHTLGRYWVIGVFIASFIYVTFAYKYRPVGYMVGLFTPCGLMLPAFIISYLYKQINPNQSFMKLSWIDVVILSSLQLVLMLSSWSVLPWDIYRIGYTPWATLIALGVLIYSYLRNLHVIAIVSTVGLIFWGLDLGGDNYFDYISHSTLLIIAWVWLIWHALVFLKQTITTLAKNRFSKPYKGITK